MSTKLINITLKDYQVWGELNIELSPFTVIVGPSGYGKSSILRALHGIFTCPTGTSHIRHGAKQSRISIATDDQTIIWAKSKKTNYYRLDRDDVEQTEVFDKVGRAAPEEILKLLNLPTVELDDRKYALYYDGQFDPPFLVFESPPQAARILMAVTGVERLTGVQKKIGSDRRSIQYEMKAVAEEVARIEGDKRLMLRVKGCLDYQLIEPLFVDYRSLQDRLDTLTLLKVKEPALPGEPLDLKAQDYITVVGQLADLPDKVEPPEEPVELQSLEKYNERYEHFQKVRTVDIDLGSALFEMGVRGDYLKEAEQEYAEVMADSCPLCERAFE